MNPVAAVLIYIPSNIGSRSGEASPWTPLITLGFLAVAAGVVYLVYLSWKKEQKQKRR